MEFNDEKPVVLISLYYLRSIYFYLGKSPFLTRTLLSFPPALRTSYLFLFLLLHTLLTSCPPPPSHTPYLLLLLLLHVVLNSSFSSSCFSSSLPPAFPPPPRTPYLLLLLLLHVVPVQLGGDARLEQALQGGGNLSRVGGVLGKEPRAGGGVQLRKTYY